MNIKIFHLKGTSEKISIKWKGILPHQLLKVFEILLWLLALYTIVLGGKKSCVISDMNQHQLRDIEGHEGLTLLM